MTARPARAWVVEFPAEGNAHKLVEGTIQGAVVVDVHGDIRRRPAVAVAALAHEVTRSWRVEWNRSLRIDEDAARQSIARLSEQARLTAVEEAAYRIPEHAAGAPVMIVRHPLEPAAPLPVVERACRGARAGCRTRCARRRRGRGLETDRIRLERDLEAQKFLGVEVFRRRRYGDGQQRGGYCRTISNAQLRRCSVT